jgi:hypothetical protein
MIANNQQPTDTKPHYPVTFCKVCGGGFHAYGIKGVDTFEMCFNAKQQLKNQENKNG